MRSSYTLATVMISTAIAASSASANFSAHYIGYGEFQNGGVGYSTALAWNSTAAVTMFNLKLAEHKWDVGGTTVYTWCAQVYQGVTAGYTYDYSAVELELAPSTPPAPGPMGVAKACLLRDTMSRWLGADGRVIASAGSAPAATAAFAALAWEIIHENLASNDVEIARSRISAQTGAFRIALTGEAAQIFANMVSAIGQGGFQFSQAEGWNSPTAQDQFRFVPSPGALALLGLAGFVARRRR